MSLPALLMFMAGSLSAVAVIIALHAAMGRTRTARLESADQVRAVFATDFPDESPATVTLSRDATLAFLTLPRPGDEPEAIGVVQAMGTFWATRILEPGMVARVEADRKGGLRIRLRDFTGPALRFDPAEPTSGTGEETDGLDAWIDRLCALQPRSGQSAPHHAAPHQSEKPSAH